MSALPVEAGVAGETAAGGPLAAEAPGADEAADGWTGVLAGVVDGAAAGVPPDSRPLSR